MVPLAILGSFGMSLAARIGIGLVASAAKAVLDSAPARDAEPAVGTGRPRGFPDHLDSAASRLAAPATRAPGSPVALSPPDSLGRLALERGSRALALRAHLHADSPRAIAMHESAARPGTRGPGG